MSAKQSKRPSISDLYQIGDFIDAKDNQGDWRVGFIVDKSDITKTYKVRFDGWAAKYDQLFKFGHPKLKQFRTIVLGYTGQKQNPALRPSWKFSVQELQKKLIEMHNYTTKNNQDRVTNSHDFNQWFRGHNYFYVDFLMTLTYTKLEQIHKVIEFFKMNVFMVIKYLKYIAENFKLFSQNLQKSTQQMLQNVQIAKSFAFYQIFDTIYTIIGCYQRLSGFFKQNEDLLREQFSSSKAKDLTQAYQIKIVEIFYKNQGFQIIQKILSEILQYQKPISFVFLESLAHLYAGVSCVVQAKSKENTIKTFKKITEKSLQYLGDKQLKDFYHQQILNYLTEVTSFSRKTALQGDVDEWTQKTELEIYYKMIICPFFEKKLRGITSLHEFVEFRPQLIADGTISKWIQEKRLFDFLFGNDNPEIIKKATEFLKLLYTKDNNMQKYILLVWKQRQGKHETALKQIYSFIGDVPIYDKNQQFTVDLFKKHLATVDETLWDPDYIKMIKDYTSNALFAWSSGKLKQTFGFKIIYKYLQKNQLDTTLISYLIQILEKLQKSQFLQKFMTDCFINIQTKVNQSFHISLLLRILKQKIADMRNIQVQARQIVQQNIIFSKNSDNQNMPQQFELLNQILKQAKQIIPQQDFIKFWKQMINSKSRMHFFKWLYKVRDSGKVVLTNYINQQTKAYLLQNFWTNQYLQQNPQFDEYQATFLLELFKNINNYEYKIKRINIVIGVLDQNLIGIDKLHLTYQLCQNNKADQIVAKGLAEIYMSQAETLNENEVNLIHKFIQKIVNQINVYSKKNDINGIRKAIRLIEELLLRDQEIFQSSQGIRTYSFKDFPVKNLSTNQQKIIKFNIVQNVYDMKKLLSEKFNIPLYKFDLIINQKQVLDNLSYFRAVVQLDIKGKICLKLRSQEASKVKTQLNHHLELLFQLLGNKQIQQRVWNIVAKLPISQEIRQKIIQSQNPLKIIQDPSFYKQLYLFKVVISLQKKWWSLPATDMIYFFVQKFLKIQSTTQIQREYIMVSMKILQNIIQSDEVPDAKVFSYAFQSAFQVIKKILYKTNQIEQLNTFYIKKSIETFFSIGQAYNKFLDKKQLKSSELDALSLILKDPKIENIFKLCLIEYKHQSIRKQFPIKLVKLASFNRQKYAHQLVSIIFNDLLDYTLICQTKNLKQFNLFSCLILESMTSNLEGFYAENSFKLFNKLFKLIQNQQSQQNNDTISYSLQNYLNLMRYVLQFVGDNDIQKLFDYIYQECLFKGNLSKCKSKQTRTAAFNIFQKLIKYQKKQNRIVQKFGALHQKGIWRSRKLQDWTITCSDRLKSSTGYVGLRNLGCICYMNSFFQQIFMIEQFRLALLLVDDPAFNPQQVGQNVLYQVKKMFINLMYSDKKAYNPKSFCLAFKDYQGNPTNVTEQMDIDQFSGILFDRLQNSLKGTKYPTLIKDTFGGIFSNQIICKGCPHFSESQESFLSLSLTVKDKKSVYQSLQTMIKGDTLDGDNAYHCERCDKKISAVKRVCLKSLPDYLIVTLKRFQFDFNTMNKLKINEYCEFPHQINLEQYSYEYLRKKENPKAFEGEELKSKKYYQYKLKGVVIHVGYSDSGHYYSLIQERSGQERWLQFNDTTVRKFNVDNLHDEAFGGQTGGTENKQKIKNAYMLIYERVQKINSNRNQIIRQQNTIKNIEMYKQIFETLGQQNLQYNVETIVFSAEYLKFIFMLIEEAGKNRQNIQLQKFVILAVFTVIIRSKSDLGTFQFLQKMYNSFVYKNQMLNRWILSQFSDTKIFEQFFRNCPIRQTKRSVALWIAQIFRQTAEQQVKIKFLKTIVFKITTENQNTIQPLHILHNLIDEDFCLEFMIMNNVIGRILQNIIRKQPRQFGSLQNIKPLDEDNSQLGYEQIIEKSAFELKKFKYENDSGIVWALAAKIMKKFNKKQLFQKIHPKEVQYLHLNKQKIFKLLEQVKNKFDIDVLTDYLCYLSFENLQFSEQLSIMCQRGLKQFQSKRYRQFFILFSKLIAIQDHLLQERLSWIHKIIRSLKQNEKYAMDCTIIELWICKIINENQNLRKYLIKEKTIIEYISSLPIKKVPSEELSWKNANFGQNSVNKFHGIPFPSSRKGYLKILKHVQQFYQKLSHSVYEPIGYFQSGNHCVYDKVLVGDKLAYFDTKDKIDYQEVLVKQIFIDKINLCRKSSPNKTFWVWIDDQKLTSNLKVIKQEADNDLDSSKTTEMEEEIHQIDFDVVG